MLSGDTKVNRLQEELLLERFNKLETNIARSMEDLRNTVMKDSSAVVENHKLKNEKLFKLGSNENEIMNVAQNEKSYSTFAPSPSPVKKAQLKYSKEEVKFMKEQMQLEEKFRIDLVRTRLTFESLMLKKLTKELKKKSVQLPFNASLESLIDFHEAVIRIEFDEEMRKQVEKHAIRLGVPFVSLWRRFQEEELKTGGIIAGLKGTRTDFTPMSSSSLSQLPESTRKHYFPPSSESSISEQISSVSPLLQYSMNNAMMAAGSYMMSPVMSPSPMQLMVPPQITMQMLPTMYQNNPGMFVNQGPLLQNNMTSFMQNQPQGTVTAPQPGAVPVAPQQQVPIQVSSYNKTNNIGIQVPPIVPVTISDTSKRVSASTLVTPDDLIAGLKNLKKNDSVAASKPTPMSMSSIAEMAAKKARERQAKRGATLEVEGQLGVGGVEGQSPSSPCASSNSLKRRDLEETLLSRLPRDYMVN